MAPRIIFFLVIFQVVFGDGEVPHRGTRDGFIDHLNNGMKFAKDFLGSESVALKVAEFVVKAFQTANTVPKLNRRKPYQNQEDFSNESFQDEGFHQDYSVNQDRNPLSGFRHMVKLFGLQPSQISAVAVNALLFVAQMISTFLSGPKRPRKHYRDDDPTSWILNKNSQKLQDLLATARNESLSEMLETIIKERGSDEDTSCIRLLVCKITPFIIKMQKAVFEREEQVDKENRSSGADVMYRHLPSAEEINDRNDMCEVKHRDCDLNE